MKERLKRKIIHLIESKSEGDYWDFKQEWHKDNERLIHDILCFTNTVHDRDCYLIIGVSDKGEVVGVNEEGRLKQAGILDLLSNTVFAGDFTPEVMVDTIEIEDKEIDILIIFNSYTVPYYLKKKSKKYQNLREGFIYTRVGDRNTPIKQNATIHQIEMLWKKRFGLTQAPLVQIVNRLENKTEWIRNEGTYYNIYKPEFRLVEEYDDERGSGQFYVYSQENSSFSYKDLSIMYNQTILKDFQLVVLDSGRFETPVPEWGYVVKERRVGCYKYTYKYYLKNSIEYKLQQFFFDISNEEELYAKNNFDEVILYFDNEEERLEFESYIKNNQNIVDQYLEEAMKQYFQIETNNKKEHQVVKERLETGLALNKALRDFRQINGDYFKRGLK